MNNFIGLFFIKNINIYSISCVYYYDKFNGLLIIFKKRQTNSVSQFFNPLAVCERG
jgi:hypothetical protein